MLHNGTDDEEENERFHYGVDILPGLGEKEGDENGVSITIH